MMIGLSLGAYGLHHAGAQTFLIGLTVAWLGALGPDRGRVVRNGGVAGDGAGQSWLDRVRADAACPERYWHACAAVADYCRCRVFWREQSA